MAIVDQSQGQVSGKKEQKKGGKSQTCLGTAFFGQSNAARLTGKSFTMQIETYWECTTKTKQKLLEGRDVEFQQ